MSPRSLLLVPGLLLAAGCSLPLHQPGSPIWEVPLPAVDTTPMPPSPRPPSEPGKPPSPPAKVDEAPRPLAERLQVPAELPGTEAPPIELPPPGAPRPERNAAVDRLYPDLPPLIAVPEPPPGPEGRPLTLADLQHLALTNSPQLRQAAAAVEAARGAVVQAGLYPNPTVGYAGETINQGDTAGLHGGFIGQTIVTGGKLQLAQAAAEMELLNAELALRKVQADLAAQVRSGYFAVLAAQETVRITRALAQLADEAFRIQVEQVKAGTAAPYEPMQLRVLSFQTRADLVRAYNRYTAAWKQLAAALGLPTLPPTLLAGRIDVPVPVVAYEQALGQVLSRHTDVLTAENAIQRARYELRLAEVQPIPNVDVQVKVQKDYTTPPFNVVPSIQVGIPVPVWNRNQGNIRRAQGDLLVAMAEAEQVRNQLAARLAEVFQRYLNSRQVLEYYRDQILPDQVRVYRGVYQRHQQQPDQVSFGDIIVAQQTLAMSLTTYLETLGAVWTAVADLSQLLQTNDLFRMGEEGPDGPCVMPVPDLSQLLPLPESGTPQPK